MATSMSGVISVAGPAGAAAGQDEVDVIIDKLLTVRGARPGKPVQLLEAEIKMLCTRCVFVVVLVGRCVCLKGGGIVRVDPSALLDRC